MFGNGIANAGLYSPYAHGISSGISGVAANSFGRNTLSGFGKGLFRKFSFSSLLNGANKTLNVVNQAIPIYYQVKPMVANAKTMFRIVGAVNHSDNKKRISTSESVKSVQNVSSNDENHDNISYHNPIFFI